MYAIRWKRQEDFLEKHSTRGNSYCTRKISSAISSDSKDELSLIMKKLDPSKSWDGDYDIWFVNPLNYT